MIEYLILFFHAQCAWQINPSFNWTNRFYTRKYPKINYFAILFWIFSCWENGLEKCQFFCHNVLFGSILKISPLFCWGYFEYYQYKWGCIIYPSPFNQCIIFWIHLCIHICNQLLLWNSNRNPCWQNLSIIYLLWVHLLSLFVWTPLSL